VSLPEKGGSTLKTKEQKAEIIEDLRDRFSRAKGAIVTECSGMSVQEMTELRVLLKKAGLDLRVVKNTLARRAVEDTPNVPLRDELNGQVSVALGYEDPVVLAKSVLGYAKANEAKFKIRSGVIEGQLCSADRLKAVASLPGREVLLSQMAGAFQAPAQKLAALMANTITQLGFALEALKAKKAEAA